MEILDRPLAAGIPEAASPPCLSLYQPTHRHHPGNLQDPIRFRHLVGALNDSLLARYPAADAERLLEPFRTLADDHAFWNHTLDGLVILAARDVFRVYRLQRTVAELAVVADSFHTKPMMRILQSLERFQVLALSRGEIRLFEGDRDVLDEIEIANDVPRTLTEALGEELTEPHTTVASYGGVGGSQSAMHHGHGGKESEIDIDTERFFRAVDRGILEHHSRPSGLPLLLATLPEHRSLFRKVSHNPFLLEDGIDSHPAAASRDELRSRAWQVVEPHYRDRLDALADAFGSARARGLGSDDIAEVARAVVAGRVATLLIDVSRQVPGRIDAATGEIEFADLSDPQVDDVLDDLGELARGMGGQTMFLVAERMPTDTGVAAIYRY